MTVNQDIVLDVARKAIHTEALALKHLEASLGDAFFHFASKSSFDASTVLWVC